MNLPLLRGTERPGAGYLAVSQSPWPGPIAIYGSPENTGFVLKGTADFPSVLGETLDALPSGPLAVFDRRARVRVEIGNGQLTSATQLQVFAGANAAAIRTAEGNWEVLQFLNATLVAPRTYELTGLLRGQLGTDAVMEPTIAAGARVVMLSEALAPIDIASSEIGAPLNWRVGPASHDIGHAAYSSLQHTFHGLGLKPYAPVHVRGVRASGDLSLSWVRRTRVGGDNWGAADVPLSEEQERYEIDILQGATVKRTLTAASPAAVYTAAQQTADFGSTQSVIAVAIHQISAACGRGWPARASV
jgi:hypothetical protein